LNVGQHDNRLTWRC